jgi:hypothetical protein
MILNSLSYSRLSYLRKSVFILFQIICLWLQAKDGSIYFLLEENAFKNPKTQTDDYYDIRFYKLGIDQITNNRYK